MKHIKGFNQFINESINRTSNKYKTQNVEWDDIEPGDFIADGPNIGEVSKVISNTKKGFTLKRVWNNVRKKDGEEFFVPHDLEAMKDYPNSIIKVVNYVDESTEVNEGMPVRGLEAAGRTIAQHVRGKKYTDADLRSRLESLPISRLISDEEKEIVINSAKKALGINESEDLKEKVDMEELKLTMDNLKKANPGKKVTYIFTQDGLKGYRFFLDGKLVSVNEAFINEGLQFNDSQGTPNKISREILGYVEKAFPGKVLSAVESVEPNGYNSMSSPVTVTNKGQATGVREYQTITLLINDGGIGKSKVSSITVGLVKRTSGPGTGYIAIKANHYRGSSANHILLDNIPNWSVAKEFYDNAPQRLKELYDEVLAKHI
jgi:hypothetical protein